MGVGNLPCAPVRSALRERSMVCVARVVMTAASAQPGGPGGPKIICSAQTTKPYPPTNATARPGMSTNVVAKKVAISRRFDGAAPEPATLEPCAVGSIVSSPENRNRGFSNLPFALVSKREGRLLDICQGRQNFCWMGESPTEPTIRWSKASYGEASVAQHCGRDAQARSGPTKVRIQPGSAAAYSAFGNSAAKASRSASVPADTLIQRSSGGTPGIRTNTPCSTR